MRDDYIVRIGGIIPRYCTGDGSVSIDDIPRSVINISSFGAQIDIHDPIATTGGGSISFPRRCWGVSYDRQPECVFGALFPPYDAPRLTGSILHTDTTIGVTGGAFAAGNVIHIGTEALYVSSVSGSQLTVIRGYLGTLPSAHYADADLGKLPVISSYPYAWVGRRVYLYRNEKLWKIGYLTDAPSLEDDTVTLTWAPLEGRLTDTISNVSPPSARLASTHRYTKRVYLPSIFTTSGGALLQGEINTSTGVVTPSYNGYAQYTGIQFLTLDRGYDSSECAKAMIGGALCVASAIPSQWNFQPSSGTWNDYVQSFMLNRMCRLSLTEVAAGDYTLDQLFALNSAALSQSTPPTAAHFDPIMALVPDTGGGARLTSRLIEGHGWSGLYGYLWTQCYKEDEIPGGARSNTSVGRTMSYNVSGPADQMSLSAQRNNSIDYFLPPPDEWTEAAIERGLDLIRYPIRPPQGVNSVIQDECYLSTWLALAEHVSWSHDKLSKPQVANRWWEWGEKIICLDQSLGTGSFMAHAIWSEPQSDTPFEGDLKLSFLEGASSLWVYAVDLQKSGKFAGIGDWGGLPATLARCQKTPFGAPWEGMLDVIESIDGSGGSFGTLAAGLAIPEDDIDVSSFERWEMPLGGLTGWRYDVTDQSAAEALFPSLLLTGTGIAGKYTAGGGYKLTRINITPPEPYESVLTLTDDDLIGLPSSGLEGNIITQYEILCNDVEYTVKDVDAIQIYGQGGALSLDLSGARIEGDVIDVLQSALSRCVETHGKPFRKWSLTVPFELGGNLSIGDVITVSSAYLYGYGIGRGVTSALARITELEWDVMQDTVKITCLASSSAVYPAGYQPWAIIKSNGNTTTFTIPPHDATYAGGTISDIDYFRTGATVRVFRGDMTSVTRTISSKTSSSITFSSSVDTYNQPWIIMPTALYSDPPRTDLLFVKGTNAPV